MYFWLSWKEVFPSVYPARTHKWVSKPKGSCEKRRILKRQTRILKSNSIHKLIHCVLHCTSSSGMHSRMTAEPRDKPASSAAEKWSAIPIILLTRNSRLIKKRVNEEIVYHNIQARIYFFKSEYIFLSSTCELLAFMIDVIQQI